MNQGLAALGYSTVTVRAQYLAGAAGVAFSSAQKVLKGKSVQKNVADRIAAALASIGIHVRPADVMYGTTVEAGGGQA